MNSLYTIVSILAAIALISSTIASLQQQASAIIVNWREEFRVLTDEFEDAVSNATDQEPPNLDSIQQLVDDYKTNLTKIFENSGNYTGMLWMGSNSLFFFLSSPEMQYQSFSPDNAAELNLHRLL